MNRSVPMSARWTIEQAASWAHCSPKTIRRRIADGTLTGYRFGPRLIRLDPAEVEEAFGVIPTVGKAS